MTTHEFLVAREVRVLPADLTRRSADASALSPTLRPSSRRTCDERPAARTFLDTGLPRSFIVPGTAPSANSSTGPRSLPGRSGGQCCPRAAIAGGDTTLYPRLASTQDGQTDRRYCVGGRAEMQPPLQPSTEEQIQAATVGEPHVHNGPVALAEYDLTWPEVFGREAQQIANALGGRAIRIEHVGSTSVPGLAAKPIVDILMVVADSASEDTYVPAMKTAGYALRIREPAWYEHRMFKGRDGGVQVHVFTEGCPEIDRLLLFRERLRTNRADRELYERTKRELAAREWKYVQNYADAKDTVVEEIIARARAEEG